MINIIKKVLFSNVAYWVVILLVTPTIAEAYIDPGTGSLIIQAVIAFIAGTLFFARFLWERVTYFFRRGFYKKKEPEGTSRKNGDKS